MKCRTLEAALRIASLSSVLAMTACGSSDDGGDGSGRGGADPTDTCGIDVTLSGDAMFDSDLDTTTTCITSTTLGPYVAYTPGRPGDIAAIELSVSSLEAGRTGTAVPASLTIDHTDGAEFVATGCSVDVSENALHEMTDVSDSYRVVGTGSCSGPGVVDARSISVVGFFRFVATFSWPK
ncbi:MAG TPA: hypothetical protein VF103_12650 [Polyangiaceae bacterium]